MFAPFEKRQSPSQNWLSSSGSEKAKTTVAWPVAVTNTMQAHIAMEPPARHLRTCAIGRHPQMRPGRQKKKNMDVNKETAVTAKTKMVPMGLRDKSPGSKRSTNHNESDTQIEPPHPHTPEFRIRHAGWRVPGCAGTVASRLVDLRRSQILDPVCLSMAPHGIAPRL